MAEYKPKIIASSVEEFQTIFDKLQKFEKRVTEQFETVTKGPMGDGLDVKFKQNYGADKQIVLPKSTSQIHDFGDYIGIYAEGIFMRIEGDLYKSKKSYIILNY